MGLAFCAFGSGSSGNSYFIKSDNANILVDVGISAVHIFENLKLFGVYPAQIDAVVLTHEHVDHVRSIKRVTYVGVNSKCYTTKGTFENIDPKKCDRLEKERIVEIRGGEAFAVNDVEVRPFSLSHDAAEPVGFSFVCGSKKISIVTDTGCVTDEIREAVAGSDLLVVEANHEENILLYGRYPYHVKRRILSDLGHLSNEASAECICGFLKTAEEGKVPRVLLAHLSKENNTPKQAMLTVRNLLEESGYYVGRDLLLDVIDEENMTDLIFV